MISREGPGLSNSTRQIEEARHADKPSAAGHGSDEGDTRAFNSYLTALRYSEIETPRIRALDLVGAIVASLLVLVAVFGPWIRYVSLRLTVEYVPGYETDGVFLIPCALVAIGSMVVAWRRGPGHGDIEALTALVASIVGIIIVVVAAMYLDGHAIEDASGREEYRAAWGVYLAGISSVIAAIFSFRAMRSVQV
jgi:uncharacterized membrane protein